MHQLRDEHDVCRPIEEGELRRARQQLLMHPLFDDSWLTAVHALFRYVPAEEYERILRQVL